MQTTVWHQHRNYIKVVVKSRNFYSIITLSERRKKKICSG